MQQVLAEFDRPSVYISADEPALRDTAWLAAQWDRACLVAQEAGRQAVRAGQTLALAEEPLLPE